MRNQIRRSFNQGRDSDLAAIAHRIVQGLTNNASDYPALPQPISVLAQALEDFRIALSNAAKRDKGMVAIKNEKRTALRTLLKEFADYVNSVADGNKALLINSGFDCTKERGEVALQPIATLDVAIGPPGQATTSTKKITGARTYIHEYTTDDLMGDKSWVSKITTDRVFTFSDLGSGVKHWFRVKAVGYGGQMVQSPIVPRFVQ